MKKIAIIYDRVNKFGGAEQVLRALHDIFPDAPLFTSVYHPDGAKWTKEWKVHTSFIQKIPFANKHHEWFGWLMPLAFETFDLSDFDIVISVTSEAAKGVLTHPGQLHICYCLTPTRYLWSHTHEYEGKKLRWLKRWFFYTLRSWDFVAARRPDKIIAISTLVKHRIEKYYRRNVDAVIYPPAVIERGQLTTDNEDKRDYFLVVSRLVPYKKIDTAIEACIKEKKKLVIVGTGSDEKRLRSIADGNPLITFVGFVPDEELRSYYRHAIALLCPQEEDFGIVAVEAQSHGVPVICAAKSGMVETIRPGETGVVFEDELGAVLENVEQHIWNREDIQRHAWKFSKEQFVTQWNEFLHINSVE